MSENNPSPGPGARPSGEGSASTGAPRRTAARGLDFAVPNDNPIMQAASPLLLLLGDLRAGLLRAPMSGLTPQVATAIEKCEREMRAAGVAPAEANAAKYVLYATADEVLANLPDGDRDPAALASQFDGSFSRRRFFEDLDRAKANPMAHRFLLELFHACLALGFPEASQSAPSGAALQDVRRELYELLRKASPPPNGLSPHWRGQPLAHVNVRTPFWAAAALVGLLVFGVFLGLRVALANKAEAAAKVLAAVNPATPAALARKAPVAPPPAPPPNPAQIERIRTALDANIPAGALGLESGVNQIVIQVPETFLFRPGRTTLAADAGPLLSAIALALDSEDGAITVAGRSDGGPLVNARFGSDFELALDRAKAVAARLRQSLTHPERVDAQAAADEAFGGGEAIQGLEIIIPRSE